MSRPLVAGLAVCLLLVAGLPGVPAVDGQASKTPATTVQVGPDGDSLWPYTSRSTTFESRTLVLNAIVMSDPKTVETLLARRAATNWTTTDGTVEPTAPDESFRQPQVASNWRNAHGSVRYTYADTGKADGGTWLKQRYQLHVGTYLGTRHHIRAFAPSEQSSWTALQAHSEYWDWFRLRHTVTDVQGTAELIAADFESLNGTSAERRYTRDSGPLSRGIVVVSSLLPILAGRRRWADLRDRLSRSVRSTDTLAVFAIAVATPPAVRIAGVVLERVVPLVNPKLFVVLLYPCLVAALPLTVARRGADCTAVLVGLAAVVGLAVGFAAEFAMLGVTPPRYVAGHRLLAATALGLLAAGGTAVSTERRWRSLCTLAGVALWLWAVAAPLFGFV